MKKRIYFLLGGIILLFNFINAQNTSALSLTLADFNILRNDYRAIEGRIEYRYERVNYDAIPFVGVMANADRAFMLYGGLMYDIVLFDKFFITPSFAPAIYFKGKSKNLDFIIEFRSQIEVTALLDDGTRFGFSFNHISNGRLSLYNPGVESFAVTYIVPF